MKTKIYLLSIWLLSFFLFTGYHFQKDSGLSTEKPGKKECPYLQQKSENVCPYLDGKIKDSSSSCPYLNGELECPYNGKESKTDTETSLKEKSKEKKFYRTIKTIST